MSELNEDGRLAALTRDILGAKGLTEIAKGLLDALTPERRTELAEQLILSTMYGALASEMRVLVLESITPELKERFRAAVQAKLHESEPEMVSSITEEAKRTVLIAAKEALRRW